MNREEKYKRLSHEAGRNIKQIRAVAEDESFFDSSPDHGAWLDSCEFLEFLGWMESALEEDDRVRAEI